MTWILEQPLAILLLGVGLLLLLASAWSATGRRECLMGLGAVLALMVIGLIVERLVVTDRETIQATLQQIARDVERNDVPAVLRHIHPDAVELQQKAAAEMPNYHFSALKITKIHRIEIEDRQPPAAKVEFNALASGSFRGEGVELSNASIPRWAKLQMVRDQDGRWMVAGYEHAPPQQMLLNQPAAP